MIKLSKRLQAIADCIDEAAAVADIGTDHGYLPVYLILTGRAKHVIAVDSSSGSLEKARQNAEKYNVLDKISFMQSAGLDNISPQDADAVVISGIGGENIAGILKNAPWTADACIAGKLKLILQPQTKKDKLRRFLEENGYAVNSEITAEDRGRIYNIILTGGKYHATQYD